MKRLLITLALLMPLSGCGAARGMYFIWDAQRDLLDAQAVDAPEKAVYEYTLAHEYFMKAKEEAGYSDFGGAERMARSATEWATRAAEIAEYGTSERELLLDEMDEIVPDELEPLD